MSLRAVLLLLPIMALLALPGCRHCRSQSESERPPEDEGLVVERERIDPRTEVAPASIDVRAEERTYWGMTPKETQCRAADKSGTAEMMQKEYESLENQNCLARNSKNTRMKQTILRHSSVEARNLDAGTALELYYRLAELEAKSDLLREGLIIQRDALAELHQLKEQGLKVPAEYEKLQKQLLELAGDLARAQLGIQQINGELGRLLNLHALGMRAYLWPVDSFDMVECDDDPEAAVALGMKHRAQLTLIRAVRDDVDVKTMPTMLLLLRSYNGLLGMSRAESFLSFMGAGISLGKRKGVSSRRQQMDELLAEQEYIVAQEIRLAIHTSRAKAKLVALAKEKIRLGQLKLEDLEQKKARGVGTVLDTSAQRLSVVQAQAELIQEVMAWHTARAKIKQGQGLLALECGYTPEHPWHKPACAQPPNQAAVGVEVPRAQLLAPSQPEPELVLPALRPFPEAGPGTPQTSMPAQSSSQLAIE